MATGDTPEEEATPESAPETPRAKVYNQKTGEFK